MVCKDCLLEYFKVFYILLSRYPSEDYGMAKSNLLMLSALENVDNLST